MKYIKHPIVLVILSLAIISCSNLNHQFSDNSVNALYIAAQQKLQNGSWQQAIIQLEALDNYHPFSPYSQQVQLDLIYAYYKNADLSLAEETIDRFIRLNPTHLNIDYVIYMRGLINMALDNNTIHGFFGVDRSDRDSKHVHDAFNDFSKLVRNYPNSQYVADAVQRLIFLKEQLAKHEYSIASYYMKRGAWVAVVNRVEGMLRNYSDTRPTREALKLMENAYRQMQIHSQADKVAKIIAINDNDGT